MADIGPHISYRLNSLGDNFSQETLQRLAAESNGVFEWACLASDFISERVRVLGKRPVEEILIHAYCDRRTLLDTMYINTLRELTRGSSDMLIMFRSVMRQILWLKEPLPISALDSMRNRLPRMDAYYPVSGILRLMALLLSGTTETSTFICPLHPSFYDFLMDEQQSGEFFIQPGDVHRDLAIACLSIMQTCLHFNICGLETSDVPNVEVADLDKSVGLNIPPHLLYACQLWATHLQNVIVGQVVIVLPWLWLMSVGAGNQLQYKLCNLVQVITKQYTNWQSL